MKSIVLFLLLTIGTTSYAQMIQGKLVDAETQQPIPQVSVFNEDGSVFVTSNQKGEFVIDAQQVLNTTLYVNDYEYEFSKKEITSIESFEWKLKPNSDVLQEIVIYKRPIKEVLLEIIDHSIASFSKNTKVEVFYRENYLKENRIVTYAEGMMDFYIGKKLKNVSTVVNQSRIVNLFTSPSDSLDMLTSTVAIKPEDLIESSMRFRNIKKMIESKNYEFLVESKKIGERKLNICHITPKEQATERFLFTGYLVFDDEKKLILETEFKFAEGKKKFNKTINVIFAKIDMLDIKYKTKYVDTEQFYYPTYAKVDYDIVINSKLMKLKDKRFHSYSYFYTLQFKDAETLPTKEQLFKGINLYSNGNKYTAPFWENPKIQNLVE